MIKIPCNQIQEIEKLYISSTILRTNFLRNYQLRLLKLSRLPIIVYCKDNAKKTYMAARL